MAGSAGNKAISASNYVEVEVEAELGKMSNEKYFKHVNYKIFRNMATKTVIHKSANGDSLE